MPAVQIENQKVVDETKNLEKKRGKKVLKSKVTENPKEVERTEESIDRTEESIERTGESIERTGDRTRDRTGDRTGDRTEEISEDRTEEENLNLRFKSLLNYLSELSKSIKNAERDTKNLFSSYLKEVRKNKSKKRNVRSGAPRAPHGFTKAVPVSDILSSFLNLEKGASIARPSVTKAISVYVKAHSLGNPEDGSIFKADKKLKSILGEPEFLVKPQKPELGIGYSYQNLQKYISKHFMKAS